MDFTYPVALTPDDNDTLLISFPDVPEAHTYGEDEAEALIQAVDALETAFWARVRAREDIPLPSRANRGQRTVTLPTRTAAKVALYRTMREQGVRKADLARRLDCAPVQVDRLLDISRNTSIEVLDVALATLGKRLDVKLRNAA